MQDKKFMMLLETLGLNLPRSGAFSFLPTAQKIDEYSSNHPTVYSREMGVKYSSEVVKLLRLGYEIDEVLHGGIVFKKKQGRIGRLVGLICGRLVNLCMRRTFGLSEIAESFFAPSDKVVVLEIDTQSQSHKKYPKQ